MRDFLRREFVSKGFSVMKPDRKFFICISIFFLCPIAFIFSEKKTAPLADNNSSDSQNTPLDYFRLNELLSGYLEHDLQLQEYVITAQSKALSLKSAEISNGIIISLSSGEMIVTLSDSDTKISVEPNIEISATQFNDTSIGISIPVVVEEGEKTIENGTFSVSTGIITGVSKQRKVTLLEAERALLEAKRDIRDRALSAENEFYEQLKTLYNYAVSICDLKNDLYDDELDLRVLEIEGYSKTSATYRQSALQVESDKRDIREQQRLLERETAIFARKCGFDYSDFDFATRNSSSYSSSESSASSSDEGASSASSSTSRSSASSSATSSASVDSGEAAYQSAMAFLPDVIPSTKKVDVYDFDKESYAQSESASWDAYIGNLEREADYDMTLKVSAEYILNDTNTSNYDSAGANLTWSWKGLSVSAGAYVPTMKSTIASSTSSSLRNSDPYCKFSVSLSPSDWRLADISKEQQKLDAQLEQIAVNSAENDYETDVLDRVSSYNDIIWSQESYAEEYDMYTALEADMARWLSQGLVTESDYRDAAGNKEKARLNIMINAVDLLIYNNETKLLFHDDADLQ